jgi:hypothetical protein
MHQYHWCPITFKLILGDTTSSIEYRRANDGPAISKSKTAGVSVQTISSGVECVNLEGFTFKSFVLNKTNALYNNQTTNVPITTKKYIK